MIAKLVAPGPISQGSEISLTRCNTGSCRMASKKPEHGIEAVTLSSQRNAEIEAETVDMKRRHPVAQRVHHHLQDARR